MKGRYVLRKVLVAIGVVGGASGIMVLGSSRLDLAEPKWSDTEPSVAVYDVARIIIPEHIDIGATAVVVAVTESKVFMGAPPLAADSVFVFGFDGTRVGSVYVRPHPHVLGVAGIRALTGDRVALHLMPGGIATLDGRTLELEAWRYTGITSLDAVLGDTAFASARQIRTPEFFGYWWYWGLLEGGGLEPIHERESLGLSDPPLFGLQDAGDVGICGLHPDPPAIKCWDPETFLPTDHRLREDEPGAAEAGLRGVAIRNGLVWLAWTESDDHGDVAHSDHEGNGADPYRERAYRLVVRPMAAGQPYVAVMEFRARLVRFTPHGHLITVERVADRESIVVRKLELVGIPVVDSLKQYPLYRP